MSTRAKQTLCALGVLFVGCRGPNASLDDTGNPAEDNGAISGIIQVRKPLTTAQVFVGGKVLDDCEPDTLICTITVYETGNYPIEAQADRWLFVPKILSVNMSGQYSAWWELGGWTCEDPQELVDPWLHLGSCAWTGGEYGLAPSGAYVQEDDSELVYTIETTIADPDGDNQEEVVLTGVSAWAVHASVSGDELFDSQTGLVAGFIAADLSRISVAELLPDGVWYTFTLIATGGSSS